MSNMDITPETKQEETPIDSSAEPVAAAPVADSVPAKPNGRRNPRTAAQIEALQKAQAARKQKMEPKIQQLALLKQQALEDKELELQLFEVQQKEREIRNRKLRALLAEKQARLDRLLADTEKKESGSENSDSDDSGSDSEEEFVAPAKTKKKATLKQPKATYPTQPKEELNCDFKNILRF